MGWSKNGFDMAIVSSLVNSPGSFLICEGRREAVQRSECTAARGGRPGCMSSWSAAISWGVCDPSSAAFGQKRPPNDRSWPDRIFDQVSPSASAFERRVGDAVSRSTSFVVIALKKRNYFTPATLSLSMNLVYPRVARSPKHHVPVQKPMRFQLSRNSLNAKPTLAGGTFAIARWIHSDHVPICLFAQLMEVTVLTDKLILEIDSRRRIRLVPAHSPA